MKTCPQCNVVYENDYLFCLTDGNTLIDESGEQETIRASRVVFSEMAATHSEQSTIVCSKCGLANRTNSKFCKKCGGTLTTANAPVEAFGFAMPDSHFPPNAGQRYDETRAFNTPVFTPPASSGQYRTGTNNNKNQIYILIAAVVIGVSVIAAALIYSSQPQSRKTESSSTSTNGKSTSATVVNAVNAPRNVAPANPASSLIGRKGHLTINQNIRSDPNKYSESLGVHYQDAKIQVLDETTFTNDDGSIAVWYRVRVIEDGCDRIGYMGCGNDRNEIKGQAAREGWMSAKNILLD